MSHKPTEEAEEFTIHFACSLPGEPGCGCPDGDFHGEHPFVGTLGDAVIEANRISFEDYRGDFRRWITKKDRSEILA